MWPEVAGSFVGAREKYDYFAATMQAGFTQVSQLVPPPSVAFAHKLGRPALPTEYARVAFPSGYNIGFYENVSGRWQVITRPGDFWVVEPKPPHRRGESSYMRFDTYLGPPGSESEKKKTCCSACVQGQPCCDSSSED